MVDTASTAGSGTSSATRSKWEEAIRIGTVILPLGTAVVLAVWSLFTFMRHQGELAKQEQNFRMREHVKSMSERYYSHHFNVGAAIGQLMSHEPSSAEWKEAERKLREFYWGQLFLFSEGRAREELGKLAHKATQHRNVQNQKSRDELEAQATEALNALRSEIDEFVELLYRGPDR